MFANHVDSALNSAHTGISEYLRYAQSTTILGRVPCPITILLMMKNTPQISHGRCGVGIDIPLRIWRPSPLIICGYPPNRSFLTRNYGTQNSLFSPGCTVSASKPISTKRCVGLSMATSTFRISRHRSGLQQPHHLSCVENPVAMAWCRCSESECVMGW